MESDSHLPLMLSAIESRTRLYWKLIKSLQSGLLLLTGLAGYSSARGWMHLGSFWQLGFSLFLAISGSTILNMWWDRDIDARMKRTHMRPSAAGLVPATEVFILGLIVSAIGVGWSISLNARYGLVVLAGWIFDVVVYTFWLKRRTCWAILWGGFAGAMPILAGRVLATNRVDMIGILLAASVLFWIPTHTLTFSLKFQEEYRLAGVPTFPGSYGVAFTRFMIAASSILAALTMSAAAIWIGVAEGILALIIVLSAVLLFVAATALLRPSDRMNLRLYKYASIYMLLSMLLLIPTKF